MKGIIFVCLLLLNLAIEVELRPRPYGAANYLREMGLDDGSNVVWAPTSKRGFYRILMKPGMQHYGKVYHPGFYTRATTLHQTEYDVQYVRTIVNSDISNYIYKLTDTARTCLSPNMFVGLLSLLVAVVTFFAYVLYKRVQVHKLRSKLGYSGPPISSFWFGNVPDIARYSEAAGNKQFACHEVWHKQYGDVYGYYFGNKLSVAVHDLDMMKEILVKNFNNFTDRMHMRLDRFSIQNKSIINLKSQDWKDVRSLITPVFSSGKLRSMSGIVQSKTEQFVDNVGRESADGRSIDIYQMCQQLTTDVIGKAAFAIDTKCQQDPNDFFLVNTQALFRALNFLKSPLLMLSIMLPELDPILSLFRPLMEWGRIEKVLHGALSSVLESRKKGYKDFKSVDVLQLLLMQQNSEGKSVEVKDGMVLKRGKLNLTDDDILANAYVFLLAGYETTSTALGFSIWLLAKHTEVQRRLQEEIAQTVKGGKPTYDQAMEMPYLDAVFHECLRFYPPVTGFIARHVTTACEINGHTFLPGMQVSFPTYSLHHNPDIWPNPEVFDPERFTGERTHHPMAWMPFGTGPRNCIGLRFAEMEYKMTLIKLFSRFDLSLGEDSQDPLECNAKSFIHRPAGEVRVYAKKRD